MDPHFIIFSCVFLLSFDFDSEDRSVRVAFSGVFPFSFSPVRPRSCVAVWVIQVIMVISTETSLWSADKRAGTDIFLVDHWTFPAFPLGSCNQWTKGKNNNHQGLCGEGIPLPRTPSSHLTRTSDASQL
ncbi:hypothetical protein EPR50_G00019060 [Perca flavescens]|uniref:Uncharacterized protein n=1 Tax=Perca flavescens TaxID=8167 RepID=A0A484DLJ8_PERFV|nr:hypothetical protein EPR50_G00019060 [Perca flavescens]